MRWICCLALVAGCEDWPRFSNLPEEGPFLSPVETTVLEGPFLEANALEGDFPDMPPIIDKPAIEGVFEGLHWEGQLGWGSANGPGTTTFGCSTDPLVEVSYSGDVDFFAFHHPGGPLCITVYTELDGDPREGVDCGPEPIDVLWEAALWPYADDCIAGPWLNAPSIDVNTGNLLPEPIGLSREGLFLSDVPEGDYAVYLAGICGDFGLVPEPCGKTGSDIDLQCVDYDFAVAQVPSQEACIEVRSSLRNVLVQPESR